MAYVVLISSLQSLNWILDALESNRYLQLGAMQVCALRPKLKLLQVFLEECSNGKLGNHVTPKSLEGKIRDVVYQVEDLVDELWQVPYKTTLMLSQIIEEVHLVSKEVLRVYEDTIKEIDSSILEDSIQQLGQPMGLSSELILLQTLLRDCIYKLDSNHVEKIDLVVARAEEFLYWMRPISYASKLRLTEVIEDVDSVNEHMVRICKNIYGPVKEDPDSSSSPLRQYSEIDFEAEAMNIKELLLRPSKRLEIMEFETRFSKESIARRVLNNPFIRNHFVHCGWTRGSRIHQATNLSPADLIEDCLPGHIKHSINAIIRSALTRCFNGSKYLIIIDSPLSMEALTCIRESFPDDQNGSRILLLAGDALIKREFVLPPEVIYIRDETQRDPDFVAKARQLMEIVEAEGLYFAQEGIADFFDSEIIRRLSNLGSIAKNYGKQYDKLLQQSNSLNSVLDRLQSEKSTYSMDLTKSLESESYSSQFQFLQVQENTSDVVLDQVYTEMYWILPHRLKVCFLYMAAFPEDLEISARKLFMLWIGEGFLESEGSKSMEEVAEEHLNELNNRNLIIVGKRRSDNGIKTCHIPAALRQFCLRTAREENFLQVIDRNNQKFTMGRDNKRRLSFHSDNYDDVHLLPPMPLTRSFLFFGVASSIVPDIFFFDIGFKLLKVLDIAFLRFDNFPEQIVELIHLRYLALTATFSLPASISKLLNLQILIVHGPWISNNDKESSVPTEIWDLKRLRYLCFSVSSYFPAPVKDSDMQYLHTLCNIRPASFTKHFLSCVPNVRRITICETLEDYGVHWGLPSVCLANLLHLQRLETLKYTSCLRQAKGRCVPYSYVFPLSLKKLTLSGCYLPWSHISSLSSLAKLEVLKLKNYAFQGAEWEASVGGFLRLKSLQIEETNLVRWKASRMSFPLLEQLVLVSCYSLLEIPGDISEVPTLKLIDLQLCSHSSETSARILQEQHKIAGKERLDIHILPSKFKTDSFDKL